MTEQTAREKEVTLLDLLDRILNKGVIVWGDVTISVADIDLIYLGVKVMLTSVETAEQMRKSAALRLQVGAGVEGDVEYRP